MPQKPPTKPPRPSSDSGSSATPSNGVVVHEIIVSQRLAETLTGVVEQAAQLSKDVTLKMLKKSGVTYEQAAEAGRQAVLEVFRNNQFRVGP